MVLSFLVEVKSSITKLSAELTAKCVEKEIAEVFRFFANSEEIGELVFV
jgi:hypothetical protein